MKQLNWICWAELDWCYNSLIALVKWWIK